MTGGEYWGQLVALGSSASANPHDVQTKGIEVFFTMLKLTAAVS